MSRGLKGDILNPLKRLALRTRTPGESSSVGCPAFCLSLMPGGGLVAGLGDEDIAKDALLLYATTRMSRPRAFLSVNSELTRIFERSLSTSYFCHIANTEGHRIVCDKALFTLRTGGDRMIAEMVEL